jgi:hypothetical protein
MTDVLLSLSRRDIFTSSASSMRSSTVHAIYVYALAAVLLASPAIAVAISSSDLAIKGRDPASELQVLDQRVNNRVVIAAITSNVAVAGAACLFGGPWTCIAIGSLALLHAFYATYLATNTGPANDGGARSLGGVVLKIDAAVAPASSCGLKCKLESLEFEGGKEWSSIGNVTVDGIYHDLHYSRSSDIHGLRVHQTSGSDSNGKRNEEDEGGFVIDYYWNAPNVAAYDSFGSTNSEINEANNDLIGYMQPRNAIEACTDFTDYDGELNTGLMTVGWNNQAFQYSSESAKQAHLSECQVGQIEHDDGDVDDTGL